MRESSRAALLAETFELDRPPCPATQDEADVLAAINRQPVADLLRSNAASLDLPTPVRDQIATTAP